jgi:trehalose 6-phosphate synthase/phosphatase
MGKLFIVSNRLPVIVQKKKGDIQLTPSAGGLATGLSSLLASGQARWVGWPGIYMHSREDRQKVTDLLEKKNMHPVFLSQQTETRYYAGFSNNTIWPIFHYYPKLAHMESITWEAYRKANANFLNELLSLVTEDDTVWVHDYHLFLLPQLLREKLPNINIGFFQHIPFPSYEIFRILPWREEILKGILGSDLVGFHTFDDMRHFLSSVSRILGFHNKDATIEVGYRNVRVDAFPMGIDYEKFSQLSASAQVGNLIKEFRTTIKEEYLILSVDCLDFSKGIPEKLKAYEMFLTENPEYRGRCSLLLIVVPSRTQVDVYRNLKTLIEQEIGRINGKFGRIDWVPLRYMYRSIPNPMLSALYSMADVAFVTPLRDGMNLVAKEYLASKNEGKGVLVLSEMAGASKELSDAIIVNPNNTNEVSEALKTALEMPEEEKIRRNRIMQVRIKKNNIHRWASLFLSKLSELGELRTEPVGKSMSEKQVLKILTSYASSAERILFLDYDGTLIPFRTDPRLAKPDEELLKLLEELAGDPRNRVVLISGRDRHTLSEWFRDIKIDIIAEHGVWTCDSGEEWMVNSDVDAVWKEFFIPVLEDFVDRTPGTFIEEKEYSLVWHYRNADPEFGDIRARELISNLKYLASNRDLQLLEGNRVVELKHASINKGIAARRWLLKSDYDFIFAIGDDHTDEDIFQQLPAEAVTIKVGSGSTFANFGLNSYKQVRELLGKMVRLSKSAPIPEAQMP